MSGSRNFNADQLLEVLALSKHATAIYASADVIIECANDAMIAFWGKDNSVIGKPLAEAVPELEGQPFVGILQKVLETGITHSGKNISAQLKVNGVLQTYYYDYEYRAIKDANGKTYCVLHTADDVTERFLNQQAVNNARQQEAELAREQILNEELALLNGKLEERVANRTTALAESEARLRYMLADAPIAIAVFTGRNLIIESANKKVLEAWGKSADIVGKPLQDAVPELVGQEFLKILDDVFTSGEAYYGNEVKALLKQNNKIEEVYSNFVYHPIKNTAGETTNIMLVAHVITEQVIARKRVERAEEMLRFSIKAANIGTWFFNLDTLKFTTSPEMNQMFGFENDEEITYEKIINQIPEDYQQIVINAFKNSMKTNEAYHFEHPVIDRATQQTRWAYASGKLNYDLDGKPDYFSGILIDITEQKQDEQRKNDFIGMVSHELKTPLTSLGAYIQMLQLKTKNEDGFTTGALEKANKQVKKMKTMIAGFLDVSRLQSGKIQLNKKDFDLEELVSATIEEAKIIESGHEIVFTNCNPIRVNADEDKIGNVIANLLSNAAKYSAKGSTIEVTCGFDDQYAKITVKDEGIGIGEPDLQRLFDRYYRVESNHTVSGFGIGLYLSAEIIHRHQGKINVTSEPNKGSIFWFTIPIN